MPKQLLPIIACVGILVGVGLIVYDRYYANADVTPVEPVAPVEPAKPKPKIPRPGIFKPKPKPDPDKPKPNPDKPKPGEPGNPPEPPKPQCDESCKCKPAAGAPAKQYTPVPWAQIPGLPDPNGNVETPPANSPSAADTAPAASDQQEQKTIIVRRRWRIRGD